MKKIHSTIAVALALCVLVFSLCACSFKSSSEKEKKTNITKLSFSTLKSPLELDAGKTREGWFGVTSYGDFDVKEIEFYSSDTNIATFEYDKTALNKCIYYVITGVSDGEAVVYAQTKDGTVKTEEITVKVSGKSQQSDSVQASEEKTVPNSKVDSLNYNIVREDDTSAGKAKRVSALATISENDYNTLSDGDLEEISKRIVLEYCASHKVCGITLRLCVEEDAAEFGDVDNALPISVTNYFPYGSVEQAQNVTPGDYTNFEFDVSLENKTRDAYFKTKN